MKECVCIFLHLLYRESKYIRNHSFLFILLFAFLHLHWRNTKRNMSTWTCLSYFVRVSYMFTDSEKNTGMSMSMCFIHIPTSLLQKANWQFVFLLSWSVNKKLTILSKRLKCSISNALFQIFSFQKELNSNVYTSHNNIQKVNG